jgi:hypothetical protein
MPQNKPVRLQLLQTPPQGLHGAVPVGDSTVALRQLCALPLGGCSRRLQLRLQAPALCFGRSQAARGRSAVAAAAQVGAAQQVVLGAQLRLGFRGLLPGSGEARGLARCLRLEVGLGLCESLSRGVLGLAREALVLLGFKPGLGEGCD